jgi:hypothetical protein
LLAQATGWVAPARTAVDGCAAPVRHGPALASASLGWRLGLAYGAWRRIIGAGSWVVVVLVLVLPLFLVLILGLLLVLAPALILVPAVSMPRFAALTAVRAAVFTTSRVHTLRLLPEERGKDSARASLGKSYDDAVKAVGVHG